MISKQQWTVCFLILSIPLSRRESKLFFFVLCWRTKGFAVQCKSGGTSVVRTCSGIPSPSTRKMCENKPDICCLNSQRINCHKTVINFLLCKIRGCTHSRSLEEAHRFTAASSQCEAALPLKGCNPAACLWPICLFLWIHLSLIFTCWPQSKHWFKLNAVPCFQLLLTWVRSSSQAAAMGQGRCQSARDSGTSAFNSAALKWLWNYGRTSSVSSAG